MSAGPLRRLARGGLATLSPKLLTELIRWRSRRALARREAEEWRQRIDAVVSCPDNAALPRLSGAGLVSGGYITMFNGVRVSVDGYYGRPMTNLLRANLGSHEPQEELVFAEVLRQLRPEARMMECGAYWGFYSIWFLREVARGEAWLVEPDGEHLEVARDNLRANSVSAHVSQFFIGKRSAIGAPGAISIDDFLRRENISRLDILHADIQGAEADMLAGSERALRERAIDFIFISTHGGDLHHSCTEILGAYQYEVPVSITPEQSYSVDGLIVACRPGAAIRPLPSPSKRIAGSGGDRP